MNQQVNTIKDEKSLKRACDKAILTTLAYRSVFKYPMSFHQLATFLMTEEQIDYSLFKDRLRHLENNKKVKNKKGKYHLPKVKTVSWGNRHRHSKKHLKNAEQILKHLESIKWIKMVGVTGAVAANNATKTDDIDIFVITEKNRVWLSRLFVVLKLKSLGVYRSEDDPSGTICPNIYIDEESMEWPKDKRNVYTAHEILMMHPIIDRDDTYFKFLKRNSWVYDYFANFNTHLPKRVYLSKAFQSMVVDFFEKLLAGLQQLYMKNKKTTELTTRSVIHFNRDDHSKRIMDEFHKALSG